MSDGSTAIGNAGGVAASQDTRVAGVVDRGWKFLLRLRPTLVTMTAGLALVTALAIGASAAILTLYNTRAEIDAAREAAVRAAAHEVDQFLGTLPKVTEALAASAREGALPLEDRARLLAIFAAQVRATPRVAWAGYGDASGWYAGATRNIKGEIVEYASDPQPGGGVPKQIAVAPDGTKSSPSVVETAPFQVLTRNWFKLGMEREGTGWTDIYPFPSGGSGISCVTRFTAKGATSPTGVFHIDLRLAGIDEFLSTLRVGAHGAVFLVDRDGHPFISRAGKYATAAATAVEKAAPKRDTARLDKPTTVTVGKSDYDVVFEPIRIVGDIGFSIAVAIDLADITDGIYRNAMIAAAVGFAAVILAMLCGVWLASVISRPVVAIAADLARIGNFEISRNPSPRSVVREIDDLGRSVDRMKASLRSFGHYVPTDLVRRLVSSGAEAELGGEIRRLTIHFSDVANFTSISEGVEPRALVKATGRYFELMTDAIARHGGTVDKFMGDGIMAFFNAPEDLPDHPRAACLAALEAQKALDELERATPPGEPVFRARIGLGLGDVLVGNIGTPDRFAYTLLGDVVNLASRLEGLNKVYGTRIMASETVVEEAGEGFEWRRLDRVAVKGRRQGTLVYELLGERGAVAPELLTARDLYETALDLYFAGDFPEAETKFDDAMHLRSSDIAAPTMRDRACDLAVEPPPDWDGIHVMHEK